MHVLFLIKSLEGRGGGAERVLTLVANELNDRGHQITLVTSDAPGFKAHYDVRPDIDLVGLGGANLQSITPLDLLRTIRKLRRLDLTQFDVLVGFMHSSYVPLSIAALGTGRKVIASEHTTARHFEGRPLQAGLSRLANLLSFAKTVVSPLVRDEHPPTQRDKIRIISNPVDFVSFQAGRRSEVGTSTILCPGVLRPEKGQSVLVDAFDKVAKHRPDWRLRFIGDGPMRAKLETRVALSPFRDRIEVAGFVSDVAKEYANASFVVLPSYYESFGMAIAEALASGRAAISLADCHGASLLIQDGHNGLVAPVFADRSLGLADSMARLMDDRQWAERLGRNAPDSVERYSISSVVNIWEELLKEARSLG